MDAEARAPDRISSVKRRARNACDACRARKIKCSYDGGQTVCKACLDLNVECTTYKPRKRRGPPSRYVEEQRRKQQELDSTPQEVPAAPQRIEHLPEVWNDPPHLEQLAPLFIIQQVIDNWFELIHPVAPILHRASFVKQLEDPHSYVDVDFITLVASICAAAVATLRRRTSEYASLVTVEKCEDFIRHAERIRNVCTLSLPQCLVKYNMAVASGTQHGMDYPASQVRTAEATAMVGHMIHYDMQDLSSCDRELLKRLYWLCFAANCTLSLHGRPHVMAMNTSAGFEALKPRDLTDSDLCDVTYAADQWHGHRSSYIPGLQALIDLFMLWYRSQQGDVTNLAHLQNSLGLVMSSLDHIPPELRWRGGLSRPPRSNFGTDVQMVNLYITQIHIRSFLLDQMYNAAEHSQTTAALPDITSARQNLVNDMLAIVYQMPEDTLEANGISLIGKLRDVGLALLNDSSTSEMSFVNLDRLLAKLDRLDVRPGSQADSISPLTNFTSPGFGI